ncbi:MAG: S26 family signal peptidase [Bacteroides sp.]|nr:S26 family signal peptidase [Bacteroides sp.]
MSRKEIPNNIFFTEVVRLLRSGESVTIPMRGVSMRPLLREGRDAVRLAAIEGECLRRGDVALFCCNGQYLLHRMTGRKGKRLHMHGDGLLGDGEYCNESDVMAKVTHIIRRTAGTPLSVNSIRWKLTSQAWLLLRYPTLRLINLWRHLSTSKSQSETR